MRTLRVIFGNWNLLTPLLPSINLLLSSNREKEENGSWEFLVFFFISQIEQCKWFRFTSWSRNQHPPTLFGCYFPELYSFLHLLDIGLAVRSFVRSLGFVIANFAPPPPRVVWFFSIPSISHILLDTFSTPDRVGGCRKWVSRICAKPDPE